MSLYINYNKNMIIIGDPECGKTTFLKNWIKIEMKKLNAKVSNNVFLNGSSLKQWRLKNVVNKLLILNEDGSFTPNSGQLAVIIDDFHLYDVSNKTLNCHPFDFLYS